MKAFASDNTSGVHPKILEALTKVNSGHEQSYGMDAETESFERLIKETFGSQARAYLVFNGTAANVIGLGAIVKSYEGIICHKGSHLVMDECGAPEKWLGSKLFVTDGPNGKLDLEEVQKHLIRFGDQHYSQPRVISIAQPTELGTVYSLEELKKIRALCDKYKLYFHMDGARLANAAHHLNVSLKTLTTDVGVDVLSFGGTKNGLLNVEAIVILKPELTENFKFYRKQGLQLSSKHRFMSVQFNTYIQNNFWKEIASHVCELAKELETLVKDLPGVRIIAPVESNAVFAIIPKSVVGPLKKRFFFYVWDEHEGSVRWMITFDHTREDIQDFAKALREELENASKL